MPLQISAILLTVLIPVVLWRTAWGKHRAIFPALAVLLIAAEAASILTKINGAGLEQSELPLPMHLCDWSAALTAWALLRRGQTTFEIAYCWGVGGATQAMLTPAFSPDAPLVFRLCFFAAHGMILVGLSHLILVSKMRPQRGAWLRTVAASLIYVAVTSVVNVALDQNFGFLQRKPSQPSLLDFLSDHHALYLVQFHLIAWTLFALLLLPWRWLRRWS